MTAEGRRALVIDTAYTSNVIEERGNQQFFDRRHCGGFFAQIWSVHPAADFARTNLRSVGLKRLSSTHLLIETPSRSRKLPSFLAPLDVIVSQMRLVRRLRRLVRQRDIEIVITGCSFLTGLIGLALKRFERIPLVVGIWANHDLAYRTAGVLAMPRLIPSYRLQRRIARYVLSRADLVVAGNRDNLNYAIENGADPARCEVLPVVTNVQICHDRPPAERHSPDAFFDQFGIPRGRKYLLTVGRLIPVKYPEDGVRAMIEVGRADPDAIGIVAGKGDLKESLEALVASEGMADRIFFVGNISQEELSLIFPHAVTLSPITGMALVESGLGGSPIVAFDVDWQAEFIEDGVSGFIVPLHDVAAMADRALKILSNPALREQLSRGVRARALEFADRDKLMAREQAAYARVLAAAEAARLTKR